MVNITYSQTCNKISPLGKRNKWPYKVGDLLKEVQFIWNILWQYNKLWPLNTGDCLIKVTSWAGLTEYESVYFVNDNHLAISSIVDYVLHTYWLLIRPILHNILLIRITYIIILTYHRLLKCDESAIYENKLITLTSKHMAASREIIFISVSREIITFIRPII